MVNSNQRTTDPCELKKLPASVSIVASAMAGAKFCEDNKMNFVLVNYNFMQP